MLDLYYLPIFFFAECACHTATYLSGISYHPIQHIKKLHTLARFHSINTSSFSPFLCIWQSKFIYIIPMDDLQLCMGPIEERGVTQTREVSVTDMISSIANERPNPTRLIDHRCSGIQHVHNLTIWKRLWTSMKQVTGEMVELLSNPKACDFAPTSSPLRERVDTDEPESRL